MTFTPAPPIECPYCHGTDVHWYGCNGPKIRYYECNRCVYPDHSNDHTKFKVLVTG